MASERMNGLTVESSTATGRIMICMAMESTSMLMELDMKASLAMIKKKVTEFTIGWTVECTKAIGIRVSNTVLEVILILIRILTRRVCGSLENARNGLKSSKSRR